MSPQQPRRPASSRGTTPRPRKIAGRTSEPEDAVPSGLTTVEPSGEPIDLRKGVRASRAPQTEATRVDVPPKERGRSIFAGRRITRGLCIVLGVLVVLLVLQGAWFLHHHQLRDQKATPAVATDTSGKDGQSVPTAISVSDGTPVVMNQSDVDQGVDQAATDAVLLIKRDYRRYDADVAKGVDVLTDQFAQQFKATTADVKQQFIAKKTSVDAKVVAQGVVRANDTQLQALLFLDQYVTKGTGKDRRLTYTPYKVLVTMVHTDHGWLVDHLDTQ